MADAEIEIEIEIDGRALTVPSSQTIIQAADEAGIYVPRFCYHKHLSIPANCRMCLVEIAKAPKVMPACSTPVAAGMKISTKSQKTLAAQRAVMEFLLINHPLDCPICDQGGECELQDISMGYGSSWSHYMEPKRAVADQDLGPLIETEMTRCIHCTRCVRFGDEVAGLRELGAVGRGEFTEIGTYIQHSMRSEVSGNIIDLCPVGALTAKPYRFTARAWELDQTAGISPHDCVGSNLYVHSRYGKVMRVVSQENPTINGTWISDRDRFSYTGLSHPDRLSEPRIRVNGDWQVVDWQTALEFTASSLQESIAVHGADKFAGLASPSATLEEFYLMQKIVRGLGSPHIDHRLREIDTSDQKKFGAYPGLNMSQADLLSADTILLIGSHIQKEQPILGLTVRQASLKGANILVVNPVDYRFNFVVTNKKIVAPHLLLETLNEITRSLEIHTAFTKEANLFAANLKEKQHCFILLGAFVMHHPQAAALRAAARKIANLTGAKIGYLTDGANMAGAYLAGAVPHRHPGGLEVAKPGLNAYRMLEKPHSSYLLLNMEPEYDCANANHAIHSIQQANFVAAMSLYRNDILEKYADVILPMAAFTETAGTYVNAWGTWQSVTESAQPFANSRPAWKILRVLGNFLNLQGFDFETAEEIRHEVKKQVDHATYAAGQMSEATGQISEAIFSTHLKHSLTRVGEVPIYAIDSLVRRAEPLQKAQMIMEGNVSEARFHPKTAEQLQLQAGQTIRAKQGVGEAKLVAAIDDRIAEQAVWIAASISQTSLLGDLLGEIEILKES